MKSFAVLLAIAIAFCLASGLAACTAAPTPQPGAAGTPAPVAITAAPPTAGQPAAASETSAVETAPVRDPAPVLKTAAGDFTVVSARFVAEVNGDRPGPGEKILLVILSRPGDGRLDPAEFSLEDFSAAIHDTSQGQVHLAGSSGSTIISTMAGWIGPEYAEFGMGFRVPEAEETYQLVWPGNAAIEIFPEKS